MPSHPSATFASLTTTATFDPLTTSLRLYDPRTETMTDSLEITTGDTHEPVRARLFDPDGDPVDFTDARVTFRMTDRSGEAVVDAPAQVEGPEANDGERGWVRYSWRRGETDRRGLYGLRFVVRYSDGTRMHYPNSKPATLFIRNE